MAPAGGGDDPEAERLPPPGLAGLPPGWAPAGLPPGWPPAGVSAARLFATGRAVDFPRERAAASAAGRRPGAPRNPLPGLRHADVEPVRADRGLLADAVVGGLDAVPARRGEGDAGLAVSAADGGRVCRVDSLEPLFVGHHRRDLGALVGSRACRAGPAAAAFVVAGPGVALRLRRAGARSRSLSAAPRPPGSRPGRAPAAGGRRRRCRPRAPRRHRRAGTGSRRRR